MPRSSFNLSDAVTSTTLATVVRAITTTLRLDYGIDPIPVLRHVDIAPQVQEDNELRLPMVRLKPLWDYCVELTGDPAFGLKASRHQCPSDLHGIDIALSSSATLGESVKRYMHYLILLSNVPRSELYQDEHGDWRLEFTQISGPLPAMAARDYFMAMNLRLFEKQTGVPADRFLRRLDFISPDPESRSYWSTMKVPVTFGQERSALVFKAEAWDMPSPGANPRLLAQVEQPILAYLAECGMPLPLSALRARLADMLGGPVSLEQLAESLQLPVKNLHDSLERQGLNFARLLDQTREELTLTLLEDPALLLKTVASRVGFSTSSGLIRAFVRWRGCTPNQYRRQLETPKDT